MVYDSGEEGAGNKYTYCDSNVGGCGMETKGVDERHGPGVFKSLPERNAMEHW